MKRSKQLARARLERDIWNAVSLAAATAAYRQDDPARAKAILNTIMDWRRDICDSTLDTFDRNWTFTERARGERTAT